MAGGPKGANVDDDADAFVFGDFKLVPKDRQLYEEGHLLEVGGRAFDVLLELVRNAGELVATRELMARVWSDAVVEEVNVRVHVASLRKTLRDGRDGRRFIATSIGSGYTFVERVARVRSAVPNKPGAERAFNLPRAPRMIGRDKLEASLAEAVSSRRMVTLVGPGGIGKTALGIAVAHRVASTHADGAVFVDLGTVAAAHVLDGFASALGTRAVSSASSLAASLAARDMLLVLDNCEHVVDVVADVVGELLAHAPKLRIVATSREALRSEGEWVYRVPSLDIPDVETALTADEALGFSSVALFVDRAVTEGEAYALTDADVATVIEICRRLDGIPLAIELAASRVGVLGVAGLDTALHSHLGLAMRGPRSAPPRQRTLRAIFDWSYTTLSSIEQKTLRALSVFRGPFTLECAAAVAAEVAAERLAVFDAVAGLVDKSMLSTDARADEVRFRLLESTREFGKEHLRALGELEAVERRHAIYYRAVCEDAERQLPSRPASDWIAAHRWRMDDVRGALGWAFGPSGDVAVGVGITVASIALWFEVCSLDEYRQYVERALSVLHDEKSPHAAEREVKLRLALGIMILHTVGPIPAMTEAIRGGLNAAEQLSPVLQMQAIGAMWVDGIARADYHAVLAMAERFAALANKVGDPAALVVADRLIASARHFFGRLVEGRRHAERVLAAASPRLVYSTPLQVDGRVTMLTLVARSQWLEGYPEAAARTAREGLDYAMRLRHVGAICYVLALGAIPVAVWSGDIPQAELYIEQLIASASRVSFGFWSDWGRAYARALRLPVGHGLFARDLVDSSKPRDHLVTFRADLLDDETATRVETGQVGWCAAEVRRAQAVRVATSGDAALTDQLLDRALATAKQQGALGWELRIAIDIAEQRRDRGEARRARAALAETFSRFTEGAATADHRRAVAVIASLTV
jgi:predicted ATPase